MLRQLQRKERRLFILVLGIILWVSLVSIAKLVQAAPGPSLNDSASHPVGDSASHPVGGSQEDTNRLKASPVVLDSPVGAAEIKDCTNYYFHNIVANVGSDGTQRIANRTVPSTDVAQTVSARLSSDTEIVRFYSSPSLTDSWQLSEDITGLLWINSSRPDASLNVKMLDYNPANGQKVLLGEFPFSLLSAGEVSIEFNLPVPAAPIAAGHRLLFVLEGKKTNPPPDVTLLYDSANRASRFTICQLIPGGAPPTSIVYLPIIINSKSSPMTILWVESSNTGGINPVRILNLDTNQELLRCTIGNNTTQLCGSFITPSNGTYKIIAQTLNCGSLQGTFSDATPGGTVTRRIFCN